MRYSRACITSDHFDQLLDWLDGDRNAAGEKYERIRERLIRFFSCRICPVPEDLADETIDRVALKLPSVITNYVGEPAYYFRGVANYVWLEHTKASWPLKMVPSAQAPDEEDEKRLELLEICLSALPEKDKELLLSYYSECGANKIGHRQRLANAQGMTLNALRIKMCRLRSQLQNELERCMG